MTGTYRGFNRLSRNSICLNTHQRPYPFTRVATRAFPEIDVKWSQPSDGCRSSILIMKDVDLNPFSPPRQVSDSLPVAASATRWRLIPASISFLLGLASFIFGVFAVAVMAYVLMTQNAGEPLSGMIAGCTLYLGFGVTWMLAGWLYWHRYYRIAAAANGVGILFPVVLFAIFSV